jgi:hypothetical protein
MPSALPNPPQTRTSWPRVRRPSITDSGTSDSTIMTSGSTKQIRCAESAAWMSIPNSTRFITICGTACAMVSARRAERWVIPFAASSIHAGICTRLKAETGVLQAMSLRVKWKLGLDRVRFPVSPHENT